MKEFNTIEEVREYIDSLDHYDYEYRDNYRFAYLDDEVQMKEYDEIYNQGCCGYFDEEIIVGGRAAKVGFNYGH